MRKVLSARGTTWRFKSLLVLFTCVTQSMQAHRALADGGVFDTTFGSSGLATTEFGGAYDAIYGMALQPDGKIVAIGTGGSSNRCGLARFLSNGQIDTSFASTGQIIFGASSGQSDVALLPNGQIIAAMPYLTAYCETRGFQVYRLNSNGVIDYTFGSGGKSIVYMGCQPYLGGVLIQPDGRILVGGYSTFGASWDWGLARFNPDGSPDSSFGTGGKVVINVARPGYNQDDFLTCMALYPDGRFVVGGVYGSATSTGDRYDVIARFLPNGQLDPTFATGGICYPPITKPFSGQAISDLALLPNGKILAVNSSSGDPLFFRLNQDGSMDTCWGDQGRVLMQAGISYGSQIELDPDGRILLGFSSSRVARFLSNGTLDTTFGSGGIAVPSIQVGTSTLLWSAQGILVGGSLGSPNVDMDFGIIRFSPGTSSRVHTYQVTARDALASTRNGKHYTLTDGDTDINVYRSTTSGLERRGILEFDLSGFPGNLTPSSGRIDLTINVITTSSGGYPSLQFHGYAGDGVLTTDDAALSGEIVGNSGDITSLGALSIPITDLTLIDSLLGSPSPWLGTVVCAGLAGFQAGFYTSEGATYGSPPELTLNYVIPLVPTDSDDDGDVDAADAQAFMACATGPAIKPAGCCTDTDFDGDLDVDMGDFGILQRCFSGAGRMGDPRCAD